MLPKLVLLLFVSCLADSVKNPYCNIKCGNEWHVVCKRKSVECGPSSICDQYVRRPMSDDVRWALLEKHNYLRNKVATTTEGRFPMAANMKALNWNFELEFIAQCLANQCKPKYDTCIRAKNFLTGQNIAYFQLSNTKLKKRDFQNIIVEQVKRWYEELRNMPKSEIDHFALEESKAYNHFAQLIWGDIEFMGCAMSQFKKVDCDVPYILLICLYGGKYSGGRVMGRPVYVEGTPCAKCVHEDKCNKKFPGLCGDIFLLSETQSFTTPFGKTFSSDNSVLNATDDETVHDFNTEASVMSMLKIPVKQHVHRFLNKKLDNLRNVKSLRDSLTKRKVEHKTAGHKPSNLDFVLRSHMMNKEGNFQPKKNETEEPQESDEGIELDFFKNDLQIDFDEDVKLPEEGDAVESVENVTSSVVDDLEQAEFKHITQIIPSFENQDVVTENGSDDDDGLVITIPEETTVSISQVVFDGIGIEEILPVTQTRKSNLMDLISKKLQQQRNESELHDLHAEQSSGELKNQNVDVYNEEDEETTTTKRYVNKKLFNKPTLETPRRTTREKKRIIYVLPQKLISKQPKRSSSNNNNNNNNNYNNIDNINNNKNKEPSNINIVHSVENYFLPDLTHMEPVDKEENPSKCDEAIKAAAKLQMPNIEERFYGFSASHDQNFEGNIDFIISELTPYIHKTLGSNKSVVMNITKDLVDNTKFNILVTKQDADNIKNASFENLGRVKNSNYSTIYGNLPDGKFQINFEQPEKSETPDNKIKYNFYFINPKDAPPEESEVNITLEKVDQYPKTYPDNTTHIPPPIYIYSRINEAPIINTNPYSQPVVKVIRINSPDDLNNLNESYDQIIINNRYDSNDPEDMSILVDAPPILTAQPDTDLEPISAQHYFPFLDSSISRSNVYNNPERNKTLKNESRTDRKKTLPEQIVPVIEYKNLYDPYRYMFWMSRMKEPVAVPQEILIINQTLYEQLMRYYQKPRLLALNQSLGPIKNLEPLYSHQAKLDFDTVADEETRRNKKNAELNTKNFENINEFLQKHDPETTLGSEETEGWKKRNILQCNTQHQEDCNCNKKPNYPTEPIIPSEDQLRKLLPPPLPQLQSELQPPYPPSQIVRKDIQGYNYYITHFFPNTSFKFYPTQRPVHRPQTRPPINKLVKLYDYANPYQPQVQLRKPPYQQTYRKMDQYYIPGNDDYYYYIPEYDDRYVEYQYNVPNHNSNVYIQPGLSGWHRTNINGSVYDSGRNLEPPQNTATTSTREPNFRRVFDQNNISEENTKKPNISDVKIQDSLFIIHFIEPITNLTNKKTTAEIVFKEDKEDTALEPNNNSTMKISLLKVNIDETSSTVFEVLDKNIVEEEFDKYQSKTPALKEKYASQVEKMTSQVKRENDTTIEQTTLKMTSSTETPKKKEDNEEEENKETTAANVENGEELGEDYEIPETTIYTEMDVVQKNERDNDISKLEDSVLNSFTEEKENTDGTITASDISISISSVPESNDNGKTRRTILSPTTVTLEENNEEAEETENTEETNIDAVASASISGEEEYDDNEGSGTTKTPLYTISNSTDATGEGTEKVDEENKVDSKTQEPTSTGNKVDNISSIILETPTTSLKTTALTTSTNTEENRNQSSTTKGFLHYCLTMSEKMRTATEKSIVEEATTKLTKKPKTTLLSTATTGKSPMRSTKEDEETEEDDEEEDPTLKKEPGTVSTKSTDKQEEKLTTTKLSKSTKKTEEEDEEVKETTKLKNKLKTTSSTEEEEDEDEDEEEEAEIKKQSKTTSAQSAREEQKEKKKKKSKLLEKAATEKEATAKKKTTKITSTESSEDEEEEEEEEEGEPKSKKHSKTTSTESVEDEEDDDEEDTKKTPKTTTTEKDEDEDEEEEEETKKTPKTSTTEKDEDEDEDEEEEGTTKKPKLKEKFLSSSASPTTDEEEDEEEEDTTKKLKLKEKFLTSSAIPTDEEEEEDDEEEEKTKKSTNKLKTTATSGTFSTTKIKTISSTVRKVEEEGEFFTTEDYDNESNTEEINEGKIKVEGSEEEKTEDSETNTESDTLPANMENIGPPERIENSEIEKIEEPTDSETYYGEREDNSQMYDTGMDSHLMNEDKLAKMSDYGEYDAEENEPKLISETEEYESGAGGSDDEEQEAAARNEDEGKEGAQPEHEIVVIKAGEKDEEEETKEEKIAETLDKEEEPGETTPFRYWHFQKQTKPPQPYPTKKTIFDSWIQAIHSGNGEDEEVQSKPSWIDDARSYWKSPWSDDDVDDSRRNFGNWLNSAIHTNPYRRRNFYKRTTKDPHHCKTKQSKRTTTTTTAATIGRRMYKTECKKPTGGRRVLPKNRVYPWSRKRMYEKFKFRGTRSTTRAPGVKFPWSDNFDDTKMNKQLKRLAHNWVFTPSSSYKIVENIYLVQLALFYVCFIHKFYWV